MRVEIYDKGDAATLDLIHATGRAAFAVDRPSVPLADRDAFAAIMDDDRPTGEHLLFHVREGDTVLGWVKLDLPLADNTHSGELWGMVHPEHRHRGVGRALLDAAIAHMRAQGRDTLQAGAQEPLPGGGGSFDGARFLAAAGFQRALEELTSRLDVTTVDEAALEKLRSEAWSKADGYELIQWTDGVDGEPPAEVLDGLAALLNRFFTDTPMGDLDVTDLNYTPERLLADNASAAKGGRRTFNSAVRHRESGQVVGWTKIHIRSTAPHYGMQGITMVSDGHRGHRLGTVLKVENLRFMREREPELTAIDTDNAVSNTHMLAVNVAMGFAPFQNAVFYQLKV
ncbi:N-acetyltransferase [Actinorhabdospora filicis]|uniref:N-acetyltransferase n=1 Tax=Actinorhabdospora filicis TaxID=1785913 RepID=A0A9W6W2I3_9ACTN|nr:GNAT family N-acetyltransferase [Actinorhabdospora filicis]GLZ77047.1 N-acetyltransferase [Actinorhabdospora filicis]